MDIAFMRRSTHLDVSTAPVTQREIEELPQIVVSDTAHSVTSSYMTSFTCCRPLMRPDSVRIEVSRNGNGQCPRGKWGLIAF